MAEISRPWQGVATGDSGPYSSDQWSLLQRLLLPGGSSADNGPLIGSGTAPDIGLTVRATSGPSANVIVSPGAALVNGTWYYNDADLTSPISLNVSGNPRIDTVVLRKDWTAQTIRLAVKQGSPAVTPSPPGLTQLAGVLWESPVADIAVANGFVTILNADITPRRHFANAADGVYVLDVLNNSGGVLTTGDVVEWDATADRAVTTSTTIADRVAGVWVGRTAAGGYGRVLVKGIGLVRFAAAVAVRGAIAIQSSIAKQASAASSTVAASNTKGFAVALEITSGAGLCLCYIDAVTYYKRGAAVLSQTAAADYSRTNTAFADVNASLIVTLDVYSGILHADFDAYVSVNNTGGNGALDLILDSATRFGGANGAAFVAQNNADWIHISAMWSGLTAGSHTVKPQYKMISGAGTITVHNNGIPVNLRAHEGG